MKKKIILWAILDVLLLALVGAEAWVLVDKRKKAEPDTAVETVETAEKEKKPAKEEKEAKEPSPTPSLSLTKEECLGKINGILEGTQEVWEIYISDSAGNILMEKGSGENMRAGDIEFFFIAHQIYEDVRLGMMDAVPGAEAAADALLENRDKASYEQAIPVFFETSLNWEEETGNTKLDLSEESYPYTFWDEDSVGYTCAKDGAVLLYKIADKAKKGDAYGQKEEAYLKKHWNTGSISDAIGQEAASLLELSFEKEDRIEDFGTVTLENGMEYQIGIMTKQVTDPAAIKEKIGRISSLVHEYYKGKSASDAAAESQEQETEASAPEEQEENPLFALQNALTAQISPYQEKVSIYVKDLSTGASIGIGAEEKKKAASLIKLYVMASVYDQIQKGGLAKDQDITTLLTDMITVSHNESTNELVRRLSLDGTNWQQGSEVTNAYIRDHGYAQTFMGRDVRDYRETPAEGENHTSAADCGKILEEIYRGSCVSPESSREMLELLKQQQRRGKIPAGVGNVQYVANKTGELTDVQNDAAIVQLDDTKAYILCVMTEQVTDEGTGISHVAEISRTVYEYFAGTGVSG